MTTTDLGRVADDLVDRYGDGMVGSMLVRVERARRSTDLIHGVRPLVDHPADALASFHAPSSWVAIGVVCGGWAAPMDGTRPSLHPEARRMVAVVLLGRDGTVEARMCWPDGSVMREAPASGDVLDALRRAIGLPEVA